MTKRDVITQVLSEILNKRRDEVGEDLKILLRAMPIGPMLDDELPYEEAQELLEAFRRERTSITAWLVEAGIRVGAGSPKGVA